MSDRTITRHRGLFTSAEAWIWRDEDNGNRWIAEIKSVLRLIWAVGRDLAAGQVTLRAMSLVYTTLLSLVPLLAISFSILKGFGVHNQIEPFLFNALEPLGERRDEIVERIVDFVDNVEVGVLGSVGFLLLFYTAVSLIQKIELAFNDVWQIGSTRTISERFKDYLSVIIVGPVLIFASLGISATVMSDPLMGRLVSIQPVGWIVELVARLVPILMVSLAFTLIYIFVPHTRVRFLPALTGGLVAGVLWNALGWLFAGFVAQASRYTAIYSGFATPILFMIWLYVGWMILMVGATIAFYRQHPEYLAGRQLTGHLSGADRQALALAAVCVIGEKFYAARPAPTAEDIANELRVPATAVELVLEPLQARSLVAAASTGLAPPGFVPGRPWEDASVHDVLETTLLASRDAGRRPRAPEPVHPAVTDILRKRREVSAETFGTISLKRFTTGWRQAASGSAAELGRVAP